MLKHMGDIGQIDIGDRQIHTHTYPLQGSLFSAKIEFFIINSDFGILSFFL